MRLFHEPMTPEAFTACLLWMALRKAKRSPIDLIPTLELLLVDLPQGTIRDFVIEPDPESFGTHKLGVVFRKRLADDYQDLAGPRWVDPEALLVIRLLLLCGNSVFIDTSKHKDDPDQWHYLEYGGSGQGISLRRILADPEDGFTVLTPIDHHDLRRGSLSLKTGRGDRGRLEAVGIALDTYDRRQAGPEDIRLPFRLPRAQYKELLEAAFDLLDEVPLSLHAAH